MKDRESLNKAFILAAKNGDALRVKALMDAGAEINVIAFLWAIQAGHIDCVRLLFDKVNLNTKNVFYHPPVILAIIENQKECLRFLVESGKFDLERTDIRGDTALILAAQKEDDEFLKILIRGGAEINRKSMGYHKHTALIEAASLGNQNGINTLIEAKADLNGQNSQRNSALSLAALFGYENIVHALCKAGANIHLQNQFGNTALHHAIDSGSLNCVRLLLDYGAIISKPESLLQFLYFGANQTDPNTLYCLIKLAKHLETFPDVSIDIRPINEYIQKLVKLQPIYQAKTTEHLEQESALIKLPRDVLNIISLYDNSVGRATLGNVAAKQVSIILNDQENLVKKDKRAASQIGFFVRQHSSVEEPAEIQPRLKA